MAVFPDIPYDETVGGAAGEVEISRGKARSHHDRSAVRHHTGVVDSRRENASVRASFHPDDEGAAGARRDQWTVADVRGERLWCADPLAGR